MKQLRKITTGLIAILVLLSLTSMVIQAQAAEQAYVIYLPVVTTPPQQVVEVQPQMLNIWGYGETHGDAWQHPDSSNAGSYGLDAAVFPSYDLEVPPADYIIGRTYLSFPVNVQGAIVTARLELPYCQAVTSSNMPQPDHYLILAGTWDGSLVHQDATALWYPPQHDTSRVLGVIPSVACDGQTPVSIPLDVAGITATDVLNLVIVHPEEDRDLRFSTSEEAGTAIRGAMPILVLEMML